MAATAVFAHTEAWIFAPDATDEPVPHVIPAASLLRCARLRGLTLVWLVLLVGCAPPPSPQTGCRLDSECASGRCLSGVCTSLDADDGADATGDAETAGDMTDATDAADAPDAHDGMVDAPDAVETTGDVASDGGPKCANDLECTGLLGALDPCLTPHCSGGTCVALPVADTATCATAAVCPEPGVCHGGICKAVGKPCDDGEPCTNDTCGWPGGCQHTAKPDGVGGCDGDSPCTVGVCTAGVCNPGVVASGACRIDGACYEGGSSQLGKPCARCLPESATSTWTLLDASPCDDGSACTHDDTCGTGGMCSGAAVACTDDNPCTDNSCDPKTGCVALPNQATCDDGNPCSLTDACKSGGCVPVAWNTCDDGNPCTSDVCDVALGCVHAPASGPCQYDADPCTTDECVGGACVGVPLASVCIIGGTCVPAGTSADGQPCLVCDPEIFDDAWTPLAGKDCDDGNACTAGDLCYNGACIGAVGLCDDKNPCTKNNCTPTTGCVFLPANVPCNDGNECTSGDDCATGKCVGLAMPATACDDGNPCTDDSCLPVAGCAHAPNLVSCNDGNPCTAGDYCTAGVCHAAHVICACTVGSDCNDANPCTVDGCGPLGECINTPIAAGACNDGNACTSDDHCAKGYCLGVTIGCNDNEPCSLDGCVPATGCVFLALQGVTCSDGNNCTTGDLCVNGTCTGTPKNCDDGKPCTADACKSGIGKCEHVALAEGTTCTADGSSCTIDACLAGECSHSTIVPGLCRIGGVCLNAGVGQLGQPCLGCVPSVSQIAWSVLSGAMCSDGNACTQDDSCLASGSCVGVGVNCDDGNPCTLDVCNPLASTGGGKDPCLFAPSAASCDDGDPCTDADVCLAGKCAGTAIVCDDGNACTLDACAAFIGCQTAPVAGGTPCAGDGLACTFDVCVGAACSHPIAPSTCLIDAACRSPGQAKSTDACATCQPALNATSWSPASGAACDDGDPCTTSDLCTSGQCAGSGKATCDDGDACTADNCTSDVGCQHVGLSGAPCEDGNLCTDADSCLNGVCQAGTPTVCQQPQGSLCGVSACVPATGCHFVSKCNALEGCFQSVCTTLDAADLPAPVTVPLDSAVAPQPLAPALLWQPGTAADEAGLPHLRLAVQTRGCAPAVGLYSAVAVATLPANHQPLAWQLAPSVPPPGAAGWCALNPQFLAQNAINPSLQLAWTEGGNSASACNVVATGGAVRFAAVANGSGALQAGPLAACPTTAGGLSRPALSLTDASAPGGLAGVLARATQDGLRVWQGGAAAAWGGAGAGIKPGDVPATSAQLLSVRPVLLTLDAMAPVLVSLSRHDGGTEPVFSVDVTAVTADPGATLATSSKLVGVDNTSSAVIYRGVDAVWDPDTQRVAVLISGTLQYAGQAMGFLALARTALDAPLTTPTILRLFGQAPGSNAPPVLHAFRLAEVPGSPDFLLAFGAPDATTLELLRVHPLSDAQFTVTAAKILTSDFVTHETGDAILSFGGLSELAIAPDGGALSLVYETIGAVRLISMPMP